MNEETFAAELRQVMPEGWLAGPLTHGVALYHREPAETWSIEFFWGSEIEGGRTMHYAGKTATQKTARRLSVTVTGGSLEQLIAAARHLAALEPLAGLPWPIEFDIAGRLYP